MNILFIQKSKEIIRIVTTNENYMELNFIFVLEEYLFSIANTR